MTSITRQVRLVGLTLAAAIALSACSGDVSFSIGGKSPEKAAVEVIEDELGPALGWTLSATCDDIEDPEEGDEFSCSATNEDGEAVEFTVAVGDDEVNVNTTNVIANNALDTVEANALGVVIESTGVEFPDGSFDCGSDSIAIPPSGEVDCLLTQPDGTQLSIYLYDIEPDTGAFRLAER